jgi:hypothetical protein
MVRKKKHAAPSTLSLLPGMIGGGPSPGWEDKMAVIADKLDEATSRAAVEKVRMLQGAYDI